MRVQASISTELVLRISTFNQVLHRAAAFAAEVDCLVSLAVVARENKYVRPILTHDNVLCVKNGEGLPLIRMVTGLHQLTHSSTFFVSSGVFCCHCSSPDMTGLLHFAMCFHITS